MSRRHELTGKQWQKFKDYLPPQKPETGRPAEDHRKIINGILWKVRTGAPWRDIPERYGPWATIYRDLCTIPATAEHDRELISSGHIQ